METTTLQVERVTDTGELNDVCAMCFFLDHCKQHRDLKDTVVIFPCDAFDNKTETFIFTKIPNKWN